MNVEALYHRHKQNWAFIYEQNVVYLRLRTMKNDVESVQVCYGDKYNWYKTEQKADMYKLLSDALYDYWEVQVQPIFGRLSYRFLLHAGDQSLYYAERWCKEYAAEYDFGNFEYPYAHESDRITPPAWVKDAVLYQIFPDRFANGDHANDPVQTEQWEATSTKLNFFGGDLRGVLDRLDYLTRLGITCIYFTPLFQAETNHKYDTADYYNIDRQFGDNELLKKLVDECHQRGIRVLLDIVFNHSGHAFPPFVDVMKNKRLSPYADWFIWRDEWNKQSDAPAYETFGYEANLPKFNTSNSELIEYLVNIAVFWLKTCDIDGFRLDVANEIDHRFWRTFRDSVKAIKPDVYLVGEMMHDAMAWLQGDQLDAVMDYPVRYSAIQFFAARRIDGKEFADTVSAQMVAYPLQVVEASFQLLGSHDTARMLTLCQGNTEQLKQAVLFQFTYYGAPCIYYGDEIGMSGGDDPDNRRCMIWDEDRQDSQLFEFYQQMIVLRKQYSALRYGGYRFLHAEAGDHKIAYERWDDSEHFIVAMNVSEQAAALPVSVKDTNADGHWVDVWSGEVLIAKAGMLAMELPAFGYRLLRRHTTHNTVHNSRKGA
ncbi:alpha-glycosidase [Paenibacillus sp. FJAT-27812]|uniref:alpha-glycosidase n=1 Tax=Paenibacillus sp. FJAT-27812 TaxID=1684143 RepID=UPI0006A7A4E5|nr:alpha-glycosidase [Paenibacillus sp. FJAT-27812]